jgi:hypothetical protein
MATILLTDDEYNDIQTLMQTATSKIKAASPRAATHYALLAKLHADFLAKEDGKRTINTKKRDNRAVIEQQRQERRAASLQSAQQRIASAQQGTHTSGSQNTQSTGRTSKA